MYITIFNNRKNGFNIILLFITTRLLVQLFYFPTALQHARRCSPVVAEGEGEVWFIHWYKKESEHSKSSFSLEGDRLQGDGFEMKTSKLCFWSITSSLLASWDPVIGFRVCWRRDAVGPSSGRGDDGRGAVPWRPKAVVWAIRGWDPDIRKKARVWLGTYDSVEDVAIVVSASTVAADVQQLQQHSGVLQRRVSSILTRDHVSSILCTKCLNTVVSWTFRYWATISSGDDPKLEM